MWVTCAFELTVKERDKVHSDKWHNYAQLVYSGDIPALPSKLTVIKIGDSLFEVKSVQMEVGSPLVIVTLGSTIVNHGKGESVVKRLVSRGWSKEKSKNAKV